MKRSLTFRYTLHQMAYWAAAAGIMSFASAFLLEKGFTASQVGILLASGSLLSGIFQPLLASLADRVGGAVLPRMAIALTLACGVFFTTLLLLPLPMWLFGILYLLGIFTFDVMMPLLNAISVAYTARGCSVNYGFARGIGALAFSIAALAIGEVIARFGPDYMLWIVLALLAAGIAVILTFPKLDNTAEKRAAKTADCCSIPEFVHRYRWYCLSLGGVMLLAMFHAMTENYLIEIMRRLGGDSSSVGFALFVATFAEMGILVFFTQVRARIPDARLLKIAGLSFLLKSVLLTVAPSVGSIYLIQLLQATSYAFLSPTQLYYADSRVAQSDMVKGQAFITASYTLGCALGNLIGGQLLSFSGVPALLYAGIIMAAAGTTIFFITVDRRDLPA